MKKFMGIKPKHVVAAFASAMLFLTGCSSFPNHPLYDTDFKMMGWGHNGKKQKRGQGKIQEQPDDIPAESGVHYIADERTGFAQYMVGIYKGSVAFALTGVPCTKEVLALSPNPENRPGYTLQSSPAPSIEL